MVVGAYPYNNPRLYDQFGRMKSGLVTWEPDPNEGPYRPFYVWSRIRQGGSRNRHRSGRIKIDMVQACTEEEFVDEIKSTRRKISCAVFCCCFICALKGLVKIKDAEKKNQAGQGVEARNTLVKAKVNYFQSWLAGMIF